MIGLPITDLIERSRTEVALRESNEQLLISRRGAFSLLGLAAALGFAVPTTMLMESDAEAQGAAPAAPAPTAQPMPGMQHGMQQGQEQRTRQEKRREARRNARTKHRQARNAARMKHREARGKSDKLFMKGDVTKQK